MANITGVTVVDQRHIVATLNVAVAPVECTGGARWILSEAIGGLQCDVIDAIPRESNPAVIDMVVGPALTPGINYTLAPATGLQNIGNTWLFAVPGGAVMPPEDWDSEWPHGIANAITESVGQMMQETAGAPQTRLLRDLHYPDPYLAGAVALVESAIAFEGPGRFYVAGMPWTFASATNNALRGCVPEVDTGKTASAGMLVELDVRFIPAVD